MNRAGRTGNFENHFVHNESMFPGARRKALFEKQILTYSDSSCRVALFFFFFTARVNRANFVWWRKKKSCESLEAGPRYTYAADKIQ